MATITEFSVGCSRTLNLGNYESIRIEASVTVALDAQDSLQDASETAQKELRQLLEQTYTAQYRQVKSLL